MVELRYTPEALADLERLLTFLIEARYAEPEAAVRKILSALQSLRQHPYLGRALRGGLRELVISFGRAGSVASYRVTVTGVEVLRIRHQREAGTQL